VVVPDVLELRIGFVASTPDHVVAPQTAFVLVLLNDTLTAFEPEVVAFGMTKYHNSTPVAVPLSVIGVAESVVPPKLTAVTVRSVVLLELFVDTPITTARLVPAPSV
jgi:hypothetical protein